MYLMLGTRPDIAYTVAALGCHAANPDIKHQHALNHLFCYLHGSSDYKLVYCRGVPGGDTILRYVDANWGSVAAPSQLRVVLVGAQHLCAPLALSGFCAYLVRRQGLLQ